MHFNYLQLNQQIKKKFKKIRHFPVVEVRDFPQTDTYQLLRCSLPKQESNPILFVKHLSDRKCNQRERV